jgi:hypothetical protein
VGKQFYECKDGDSFKEEAKKAIAVDYSMWMIELIYGHYALDNRVCFDEWNHVIFPLKEGTDKNFYIVDDDGIEDKEVKDFLQTLKNYYSLRAEKIDRLNIKYISN